MEKTGRIHSLETMGALDGPGLRMVVFLQGCPQRCRYCHNPDTWKQDGGQEMTAEEVARQAMKYKRFFGKNGGVTFSGGEPLMQAGFVTECIKLLHEKGIHCAVDTSGGVWNDDVRALLDEADLMLMDIKHSDAQGFEALTGGRFETLEKCLAHLRSTNKPVWIRQVIVEGFTQDEAQVRAIRTLTEGVNVIKTELLPYHTLGVHKWEALGIPYALKNVQPPSRETMERLRSIAEAK